MRYSIRLIISCWILVGIASTIGCGRNSSETPPAASVGGNAGATKSAAETLGSHAAQSNFDLTHPKVIVETSLGNITVQIDAERAPLTVDNFLAYVDAGLYDQTIIHQVYKNQGILAGGYSTNYTEIPARTPVRNEAHNGLKNRRGTIALVRQVDAIDSATSQFFINVTDNPALDHHDRSPEEYGYCVFGEVLKGMDVVDSIADASVQDTDKFDSTPVPAVIVKSVRRVK